MQSVLLSDGLRHGGPQCPSRRRHFSVGVRTWLTTVAILLLVNAAHATDCGAAAQQALLRKTEALVVSRVPMEPVVGEMPTPQGTRECVRLTFAIGADGGPVDVAVAESSGHVAFSLAAMRAVRQYRFRSAFFSRLRTYSLLVEGVADRMPPGYLRGVQGGGR